MRPPPREEGRITSCARGHHNMPLPCKLTFESLTWQGLKWAESPWSETRRPLICRVYTGSLVYSLVALNHIKYHQECTKTHHFQIKKILRRGTRPRIAGENRLLFWTTLSTAFWPWKWCPSHVCMTWAISVPLLRVYENTQPIFWLPDPIAGGAGFAVPFQRTPPRSRPSTSIFGPSGQWLKWGGSGGSAPCSHLSPPAIVWAPLIESIKCYFYA